MSENGKKPYRSLGSSLNPNFPMFLCLSYHDVCVALFDLIASGVDAFRRRLIFLFKQLILPFLTVPFLSSIVFPLCLFQEHFFPSGCRVFGGSRGEFLEVFVVGLGDGQQLAATSPRQTPSTHMLLTLRFAYANHLSCHFMSTRLCSVNTSYGLVFKE